MKFISFEDIEEGGMLPNALISASFVSANHPDVDEQSIIFKIALPIGYGKMFSYCSDRLIYGFRFLNIGIRFTDIVDGLSGKKRHIKDMNFFKYIYIESPCEFPRTR